MDKKIAMTSSSIITDSFPGFSPAHSYAYSCMAIATAWVKENYNNGSVVIDSLEAIKPLEPTNKSLFKERQNQQKKDFKDYLDKAMKKR